MCDFHSIIVSATGEIRHTPNNSHSFAARTAGWENTPRRRQYWEVEWDGEEPVPETLCQARGDDPVPDRAERAAQRHYAKLQRVLQTGVLVSPFNKPEYSDVHRRVAGNPNTPAAVLEKLAESSVAAVLNQVARNLNTPAAALEKLAESSIVSTRSRVARNTNAPAAALNRLAGDSQDYTRGCVAANPSTPAAALKKLAEDRDQHVRRWAYNTLKRKENHD